MNNLFFAIFCTLLGAAIGGVISFSSPQDQKNITNSLFGATGGIAALWAGYGLGRWQTKREYRNNELNVGSQNVQSIPEATPTPRFTITYPQIEVNSEDTVSGSYENLFDEAGIWLCISDHSPNYSFYKVTDFDRDTNLWTVQKVYFGRKDAQDNGKNYDIEVIWANSTARNTLRASDKGLRR